LSSHPLQSRRFAVPAKEILAILCNIRLTMKNFRSQECNVQRSPAPLMQVNCSGKAQGGGLIR
ncbi:hypothetical protein, partial [Escherichia coli]|uniref:hypothetical protein n=1 Tax=Escherichia coli TaxID=562 RepID=UPI003755363B